jgi:hypothetical protein
MDQMAKIDPNENKIIDCATIPGAYWQIITDARTVEVRLMQRDGELSHEIASRRRLYVDDLPGRPALDPFDLTQRLMTEIGFEVKTNERERD